MVVERSTVAIHVLSLGRSFLDVHNHEVHKPSKSQPECLE
uniref:Uncharacterized protein n=1 Tax=Anguilla anguilla TaxID=7936 RepID=A0A0E9VSG5_ANGAN